MTRKKTICQFCNKEFAVNMVARHSVSCQRNIGSESPSTRIEDVSTLQIDGSYSCNVCAKCYSKNGISTHYWLCHGDGIDHHQKKLSKTSGKVAWNHGKTAESDSRIESSRKRLKEKYASGELSPPFKGMKHTAETRKKISESQSLAQKEGRAWNIGRSRWNNKPSYPEEFFARVIDNEFLDKAYMKEFPLGRFSLDFAWSHKKKCIEIDGKQHDELQEVRERDIRKDIHISDSGWKVLRIKWKDLYADPKRWIQIANEFIG